MTDTDNAQQKTSTGSRWKQISIAVGILAVAGGVMLVIFSTEPEAVRETATKETAMLVDVTTVQAGNYRPVIEVMGTVIPFRDVMLQPRVEGEVIELGSHFVPGRVVEEGKPLLKIDPSDYEIALRLRESEALRARADLTLEKGRREIARQDFERMDGELSDENRALVLREPQFQTAQAMVQAAEASVDRARLDLQRTELMAPFHAKVLERHVNVGSQVSPQTELAHLVDVEQFWVEATVPYRTLPRLEFPEGPDDEGVEVQIYNNASSEMGESRMGMLDQLIGSLDQQTRMVRILVKVEDPLGLKPDSDRIRLLLGTFVRLEVPLREFQNVVRLDRDFVHPGDTVWVMMEDDTLDVREVEVVFRDQTYAYIPSGLSSGERVVTSQLATVAQGARLRTGSEETEESANGGEDA